MEPTYIEIYALTAGRYGWSVRLSESEIDRCGDAATLKDALAAVVKIVEGETT